MSQVKLTKYSHGAGCGCKISPMILEQILEGHKSGRHDDNLIVGNDTNDDAAVYQLDDSMAIISTTDFFTPIVDDPFDFGAIAATNAISDIYAMGGTPFMALSILGWPIDKLPAAIAKEVIAGARKVCSDASVTLAGGHSIDAPEPIFGLAVTGKAALTSIKKNSEAKPGAVLFLTKPLGIGILTTAQKKGLLEVADMHVARELMLRLNSIGQQLALLPGVCAMTDVTGFGLLGHLLELCENSGVSAEIDFSRVPIISSTPYYLQRKCVPGGTERNFSSFKSKISTLTEYQQHLLCDPQTSGGLLIAVEQKDQELVSGLLKEEGLEFEPFGVLVPPKKVMVEVK